MMADRRDNPPKAPNVKGQPPDAPARDERSLGDLFSELSQEVTTLMRQEVALAKAELNEKVSQLTSGGVFVAAGGFVAYAGLLAIIAAIIMLLALFMVPWLAALIVGVVVAIIGYALLQKGLNDIRSATSPPERTVQSLEDDKDMVKEKLK
jgi:uncharacterized membrane protein YqjE